jgi:hypothetical protein
LTFAGLQEERFGKTKMKKTVPVFGATGTAGCACIDELIRQGMFNVRVIVRRSGQQEESSSGVVRVLSG